jgi:hypothetical protein
LQLRPSDLHEASAAALPGRREFQLLLEALAELHSIAADQHVHVLMVLQPGKEEVYLPLLEHSKADPTSALREAFDARGIQYLDLAPAFRERAAAGERLYREVDGHPNEAGYALISQLILSHLKQHEGEYGLDRQE